VLVYKSNQEKGLEKKEKKNKQGEVLHPHIIPRQKSWPLV